MTTRFAVIIATIYLSWSVAVRLKSRWGSSDLLVTFLDVGQGDAAVVQFPRGEVWMVDFGGGRQPFRPGDVVLQELLHGSVGKLQRAVVSHPDQDHLEGLITLLENLPIGKIQLPAPFFHLPQASLLRTATKMAESRRTSMDPVIGETSEIVAGVRVDMWAPDSASQKANDHSLLLRLGFGGCGVLFTGDIGAKGELQSLWKWLTRENATVMKVAHHGSKTSSTPAFLAKWKPHWSVISVGGHNQYGHPAPEVLARLLFSGTKVLRTDFHGAVRFRISADGWIECQHQLGSCGVERCHPGTKDPFPDASILKGDREVQPHARNPDLWRPFASALPLSQSLF